MTPPIRAGPGEWTYSEYARLPDDGNLVVEVLSPSSASIDLVRKPRRYLDFGVPAYWVVDPEEGVARVWSAETGPDEPRRVEGTLRWAFPEDAEALELEVAEVVAPL